MIKGVVVVEARGRHHFFAFHSWPCSFGRVVPSSLSSWLRGRLHCWRSKQLDHANLNAAKNRVGNAQRLSALPVLTMVLESKSKQKLQSHGTFN